MKLRYNCSKYIFLFNPSKPSLGNIAYLLFQTLIASFLVRTAALVCIKASVILFYKSIFVTTLFQRTANAFLVLIFFWGLIYIIIFLNVSTPLSLFWTSLHQKTNYSLPAVTLSCFCTDLILDILILSLPIPAVLALNTSPKRKYQLIAIFWLGLFCVIASACCIYYVWAERTITNFQSPQYYRLAVQSAIWSNIEIGVSVLAACLPTFGPLVSCFGAERSSVNRALPAKPPASAPDAKSGSPPPNNNQAQSAWKCASLILAGKMPHSRTTPAAKAGAGDKKGWVNIPSSGTVNTRLEREIAELDKLDVDGSAENKAQGRLTPDVIWVDSSFAVERSVVDGHGHGHGHVNAQRKGKGWRSLEPLVGQGAADRVWV
ncbi:MAG: hypothetical protein LQ340_006005 [Diploschistes diacapsis]|nr:MAG: hypothetical protein LQ340_006005 [Diploschistes diacapsis]